MDSDSLKKIKRITFKLVIFTAIFSGLAFLASYILGLFGFLYKLSLLALLIEIGVWVFLIIFNKEIKE